jgi:hypothetical protein
MIIKDLGLTYEEACHAMQTGVAYEMGHPERRRATEPKHLRVGVNSAMIETSTLAYLLIQKGVFTMKEYTEALRLMMNSEVARYEELHAPLRFR